MREILFRGKVVQDCNYKGKFIHGDFAYKDCIRPIENVGDDIIESYRLYDELAFVEVDPKTVGQFTGLLDKNGKKIFEGDIVKSKYNQITEIKFGEFVDTKSHEQVGFYQVYLKDDTWDGVSSGNMDYVKDSEIIGNIHDNGELYRKIKGEIK